MGIIGKPTGAGPPALRIPAYEKVAPLARLRLLFISRAVGSKRLEWQMQNSLLHPPSVPPEDQVSAVHWFETSCQPGMQHR